MCGEGLATGIQQQRSIIGVQCLATKGCPWGTMVPDTKGMARVLEVQAGDFQAMILIWQNTPEG
jgi:hypothetical protein